MITIEEKFAIYNHARDRLMAESELLVRTERLASEIVVSALGRIAAQVVEDFNEASELFPFWQNYPPEERGRQPRGDQYPWIEVGEHAIGVKLARELATGHTLSDPGFPTGPDQRVLLRADAFEHATDGIAKAIWLAIDIKSAGPRDDAPHAVMSPNQISGLGLWARIEEGVMNTAVMATGIRRSHPYQPMLPPLIVLSDGTVALTVTMAVKPVYAMPPSMPGNWGGQPLSRVDLLTIPNGLLLSAGPEYLATMPGLLFPGKDDANVPIRRKRARVSTAHLVAIAPWRYGQVIPYPTSSSNAD